MENTNLAFLYYKKTGIFQGCLSMKSNSLQARLAKLELIISKYCTQSDAD